MPYHHLAPMERGQIHALRRQGLSQRAIACILSRSPSPSSREFARNGTRPRHEASRVQRRYEGARKASR